MSDNGAHSAALWQQALRVGAAGACQRMPARWTFGTQAHCDTEPACRQNPSCARFAALCLAVQRPPNRNHSGSAMLSGTRMGWH